MQIISSTGTIGIYRYWMSDKLRLCLIMLSSQFWQKKLKINLISLLLFFPHRLTKESSRAGVLPSVDYSSAKLLISHPNITTSTWWVQRSFFLAASMACERIKRICAFILTHIPMKVITFFGPLYKLAKKDPL